jgi:alpha-2-macroglobulin
MSRRLGALCLVATLACSAKSSVPELPPASTLQPSLESGPARALSVAFAGPVGEAELGSTINLVFDRPLRALDAGAAPPALALEPEVSGSWQWVGARGVTFVPAGRRLPAATAFRVTVPAGTRALDGTTLSAPYEYRFQTPPPHVLATAPEAGATGQEPDTRITLTFDQPVAASTLERHGQLRALRGQRPEALAFSARVRAGSPERVDIVPRRPLPLGTTVEWSLPAGLSGSEGPRPTEQDWSLRFDTYGPLRVLGIRCNVEPKTVGCDPEGGAWVELSNAVKARDFVAHFAIEPAVALEWPEDLEYESRYFYLSLPDGLKPATSYRASVSAGLADVHGQVLAATRAETLTTTDYKPRVELPASGEVFVAPLAELSLVSRNAPDLRVFTRPLDTAGLLELYAAENDPEQRQAWLKRAASEGVSLATARDNRLITHPIALAPVLGGSSGRGAAWLGWRSGGASVEGQVVQVTDLGLTAKLSDHGSLVWVTRLSNGLAVPGATVELAGRTPRLSRRYQTDAAGLVEIPRTDYAPRFTDYGSEDDTLLIARYEGDSSFRRVADILAPWRVDAPMRLAVSEKEYALLFSERGIYRPGDVVQVKGILRREASTGNTLLAARQVALVLSDPLGEQVEKQTLTSTRYGTFSAQVRIPGSGALGQWRIAADGFADDALGIDVAEYRPAEFAVAVEPLAPSYVEGQKARFRVRGDYLFGSPMGGRDVGFGVSRERASFSPPGAGAYVTTDEAYRRDLPYVSLDASLLAKSDARLSASGEYGADVALTLPGQTGPERVRVDASVSDVSRQVISASAAVLVHPAGHYVGLGRLDDWFLSVPSTFEPRVVALALDGARLAGQRVQLELVRRSYALAREQTGDGWRTISSPVDEVQASCEVVTARQDVSCPLELREAGQFFVRASSQDARGHVARAALEFYAIGNGRAGWADNDQRKLELVLDKPQYRVGDRAKLLVKNPFRRAEALLTVERAGLYEHRRVTLEGPTPTFEISIDERLRPNAYVSVHLVQGVASAVPSPRDVTPDPGYRFGYAQLLVDPEARRLGVTVTAERAEYRPGEHVRLDLAVNRPGGAPQASELTVYAVDEGVLSLSNYQPPDPVAIFTAPRPLAVATLESRDALGRLFLPGLGNDKGMDGGGGGALGARSDFRTTALFNPRVETDAAGRATLEFELPDNLTTFRVMAVAVSDDDRYGVGSTSLRVNKPLMLRPALPRALRAGDRVEAAAIVDARDGVARDVTVGLTLTGATLEGPASRQVRLEPGVSSEVRFSVVAREPGEARFELEARSGADSDRLQTSRRVSSPATLEASGLYGRTDRAEAQALGDLSLMRQDVGGLTLQLASTALVGLDAGLGQLVDYPYACTEQLASGLLPLTPLRELSERYGLALPADLGAAVERRVGEIISRQQGEGGFGLWPDSPQAHPWASAYALWVLDQARRAGARVPARVFELGVAYLRARLEPTPANAAEQATAALMLDVLAALGQPDPAYLARAFEQRQKLPSFARALLLHAAVGGQGSAAMVDELARELEASITLHGNVAQVAEPERDSLDELFDSEARTEAMVLWALLAKNAQHPLAEPLARGVLERRQAGRWRSTQESAYALLALDAYRRTHEAEPPRFEAAVRFGERSLLGASFESASAQPKSLSVGMAELRQLSGNLLFEKTGQGTLYYEARLAYAPRDLPVDPLERGFSLQKSWRRVDPDALGSALAQPFDPAARQASLSGADLVLVDLVIGAPSLRHFVVIDDPLPAGFEAVDASLATTAPSLDLTQNPAATESASSGFRSSWFRRELRDDRVVFFIDEMPAGLYRYRYLARATSLGQFVVPPTRVEEMYQPEVFGRSGASSIEIR